MNQFGLAFHHFGLAVRAPEPAFRFLAAMGYHCPGQPVFDPLQSVNLQMCHHPDMPDVEVIWPGEQPSPLDKMLKRSDSLIYHLCYTVADAERALEKMAAAGIAVLPVVAAKPAILFGGAEVSFHLVDGFGLIELLHCPTAQQDKLKSDPV